MTTTTTLTPALAVEMPPIQIEWREEWLRLAAYHDGIYVGCIRGGAGFADDGKDGGYEWGTAGLENHKGGWKNTLGEAKAALMEILPAHIAGQK